MKLNATKSLLVKRCPWYLPFVHVYTFADVTTTQRSLAPRCPKCAKHEKNGKISCCYKGGAWDGNCGKPGDTNFDYTWIQGVEGCKNTGLGLRHQTTEPRHHSAGMNTQQIIESTIVFDARTNNSQGCVNITNSIALILLATIFMLQ